MESGWIKQLTKDYFYINKYLKNNRREKGKKGYTRQEYEGHELGIGYFQEGKSFLSAKASRVLVGSKVLSLT